MDVKSLEVISDQRVGEGAFLNLRRMRLRLVRADGTRTAEGIYDYVERPKGLDAVVAALWRRRDDGSAEVLLRSGIRVPLQFGRPKGSVDLLLPELVAGILETGEENEDAMRRRASAEALEEAGLELDASAFERLGPPSFPTPGMCPELFHFFAAEVQGGDATVPQGDGSPFEEGAKLEWVPLAEALARCDAGAIQDMKTEIGLRRLAAQLR